MNAMDIVVDLRARLGPVRHQGTKRATCLPMAASAAHQDCQKLGQALSPEWLYYHALKRTGGLPEDGLSIPDACDSLDIDGQPEDAFWPYDAGGHPDPWTPPTSSPHQLWRAVGTQIVPGGIQSRLDAGDPVIIGMAVGSGFVRGVGVTVSGELVLPDDPEPVSQGAGHALLVVGHGKYGRSPYLLVRNSWGVKWAQGGHAWVSSSEISKRWFDGCFLGVKT